jgi:hypothetical protein
MHAMNRLASAPASAAASAAAAAAAAAPPPPPASLLPPGPAPGGPPPPGAWRRMKACVSSCSALGRRRGSVSRQQRTKSRSSSLAAPAAGSGGSSWRICGEGLGERGAGLGSGCQSEPTPHPPSRPHLYHQLHGPPGRVVGVAPRRRLHQHQAEAPDVGGEGVGLALDALGGHVGHLGEGGGAKGVAWQMARAAARSAHCARRSPKERAGRSLLPPRSPRPAPAAAAPCR